MPETITKKLYFLFDTTENASDSANEEIQEAIDKIQANNNLEITNVSGEQLPFVPIKPETNALLFFNGFRYDDIVGAIEAACQLHDTKVSCL